MPRNLRGRVDSFVQQARVTVAATSQGVAERVGMAVQQQIAERPEILERIRVAQEQLIDTKTDIVQRSASALEAADQRLGTLAVPPAAQGAVSIVRATLHNVNQRLKH